MRSSPSALHVVLQQMRPGLSTRLSKSSKNSEKKSESRIEKSEEIPDDIFDGNMNYSTQRKGETIQRKTEQNVRNLQEGLSKASNVLGHISIICNSIVKMFYEDPCIRTNPSSIIY